jgi:hypothetical protein
VDLDDRRCTARNETRTETKRSRRTAKYRRLARAGPMPAIVTAATHLAVAAVITASIA